MDPNTHTFPVSSGQMPLTTQVPANGGFLHPNLLMALNSMQFNMTPHHSLNPMGAYPPNLGQTTTIPGQMGGTLNLLNGYSHLTQHNQTPVGGLDFMTDHPSLHKRIPPVEGPPGKGADFASAGNTRVWVETGSFVDSGIDSDNGRHAGSVTDGASKMSSPASQAKQLINSSDRAGPPCENVSPRSNHHNNDSSISQQSVTSSMPAMTSSQLPQQSVDEMSVLKKQMEFLTKQLQYQQYMFSQQQNLWMMENAASKLSPAGGHSHISGTPSGQQPTHSSLVVPHSMMHPSQLASMYSSNMPSSNTHHNNNNNNKNNNQPNTAANSKSNSTATTVVPCHNPCLIPPNSLEASNHQTVLERKLAPETTEVAPATSNRGAKPLHTMNGALVVGNSTEDEISSIEDEEATGIPHKHSNNRLHPSSTLKTQQPVQNSHHNQNPQQISPHTLKSEHNSQIESYNGNMKTTYSKNINSSSNDVNNENGGASMEHRDLDGSPQKDDTIENADVAEQSKTDKQSTSTRMNEQQKFDETPIFGASEKTFEQLLAEKLKSEGAVESASLQFLDEPVADVDKKPPPVKEIKKQPFLRRGQGLQRYIPGDKRNSVAPPNTNNNNKQPSKSNNHLKPPPVSSTSKLYEKNKQEEPLKVLGRSSTSDFKIPHPAISTPKHGQQSSKSAAAPRGKMSPACSHSLFDSDRASPMCSESNNLYVTRANNVKAYLPNSNSFLANVQKIEQEKGAANADLELFEMLEKAADTSGCSNVSMLLQYIANNPSASVAHAINSSSLSPVDEVPPTANGEGGSGPAIATLTLPATKSRDQSHGHHSHQRQHSGSYHKANSSGPSILNTSLTRRSLSEETRAYNRNRRSLDSLNNSHFAPLSPSRRSRSSLDLSNASSEGYCSPRSKPKTNKSETNSEVVKVRKVAPNASESTAGQDLGETSSSTLTQGKLLLQQPIVFEDELPFEDTRSSIDTEKNSSVFVNKEDPIYDALLREDTRVCAIAKKPNDGATQGRGAYQSLTSDDNVSGSLLVPVRASTPPMRKVASKRSTAAHKNALTHSSDNELDKSGGLYQSFDCGDDDDVMQTEKQGNEETRNQLVTKLFPVLAEPKDPKPSVEKTCAPSQSKSDKAVKSVAAESKQQALNSNGKVKNLPSVPPEAAAIQCSDASGAEMGSKLVEKLKHLDNEISRYRSENNAIAQLRKQREQELVNFREEVANFEREKAEELKRIEKHSLEETAKLKKERKVFEEAQKVAREHLTKREREEVESLKARICELESQLKVKDTRWKSACDRLKETVDAQKKEILELKTANQQLERLRIEQLKKQARASSVNSSGSCSANNSLKRNNSKPKTPSLSSINQQLSQQQLTQTQNGLTANKDQSISASKASKSTNNSLSNSNTNASKLNGAESSTGPKLQKHRSMSAKLPSTASGSTKDASSSGARKLVSPRNRTTGSSSMHQKSASAGEMGRNEKNVRINDHVVELIRHHSDDNDEDYDDDDNDDDENLSMPPDQSDHNNLMTAQSVNGYFNGGIPSDDKLSRNIVAHHHKETTAAGGSLKKNASQLASVDTRNGGNIDQSGSDFNVVEKKLADGSVEYVFSNGTRKEVSADRKNVTIHFFNGDYKQTREDGSVLYYYSSTQTTQTKYPDGLEILEFDCGQLEKHFKDGTKEIYFPDKSVKLCHPDGLEETTLSDGTILRVHGSDKTIFYSNGQKEIHTKDYKKREYPDGTCKFQYPDGRQETRFASGRVRIKDAAGNVLMDDHSPQHHSATPFAPPSNHANNSVSSTQDQQKQLRNTASLQQLNHVHAASTSGPLPVSKGPGVAMT